MSANQIFIQEVMLMSFKKFLAVTASLICSVLFSVSVFAADITVKINGNEVFFDDQEAEIADGRTLVPLRGVFDSMGFDVSWDDNSRSAKISNSLNDISMTENIKRVTANTKTIDIDVAPRIMNGRLMIPLRAVAESIDADVEWDENTRTVSIYYVKAGKTDESVKNVGMDEQQFVKTVFSLKSEMRDITDSMPDAVLQYAANLGNFYDVSSAKVSDSQYDELIAVLDKLDAVEPPASLYDAGESLNDYVKLIKELIDYSKDKNPENTAVEGKEAFTADLDLYRQSLEEINSRFGNVLIKYFMDNGVYWESIYGENEVLNFLLY